MAPRDTVVRISKLLVLSYVVDWVFIVGTALIGYGFSKLTPNHHPFSLTDPSISYPYTKHETVTMRTLVLAAVVAPAVIILIVSLVFTPGSATAHARPSKSQILRRKLWEWNVGWMGLGVALAGVFLATEGLKDLIGKPRPDFLARCNPDLAKVAEFAVGGLGQRLQGAPNIVSWEICRTKTSLVRVDGFSSFPSGHSSFSFAGLTYLTLWFCAKFSIGFPYLTPFPVEEEETDELSSVRRRGAAPPVVFMLVAFVPFATACFIASSRWFNYRHHGFDILFGSAMGLVFAWIGFRMYHMPIRRGAGWAWAARSRGRAFFRGFGVPSSLGSDSWSSMRATRREEPGEDIDLESGPVPPNDHHSKANGSSAHGGIGEAL
ncbi:Phosphatidic acid phosphatase type 2/haloperoxidase [Penicillium riverlandense]|uniref:Phosphatidic acid phosphatase type 2/haloperoxidase n=1 Tax=Penicillium riverlandense TaxID=1903569 RepID=UPI002546D3EC|nr:Phosphatidic acid phosphatase type 2/haloperoxidase [Penicillium riverlandense]KAJ5811745.1 Phosphatidic acid phosphatase type 2/haloperoxidase [Penicillium riverlandense]